MNSPASTWDRTALSGETGAALPAVLLRVVDAGLCGVIFIAPYFLGGRHDFGRLVFVGLVAVTAVAWFARQAMLPTARWSRTAAHGLLLFAAALVTLQIVPLPGDWIATISPRTAQLLPLWAGSSDAPANMGTWQTISLVPHETTKALAMLLCYALLFVVVAGRMEDHADIQRLLTWIGAAAALMAGVALLQYLTSDGKFLWLYHHPHRSATQSLAGPFINRNHFADFLVMGVGPLVSLFLLTPHSPKLTFKTKTSARLDTRRLIVTWSMAAATALVVTCVLLSRSRGGAVALLVSGGTLAALYVCRGLADSRFTYSLVGLAVVVGGLLAIQGGDHALSRFEDIADASFEEIDQGGIRQKLWAANVAAFEDAWLTGAGVGSHSDICQLYLPQYYTKEYTHAENSYLQIASEAGVGGLILLAAAFGFLTVWCIGAWRRTSDERGIRLLGATIAGLVASATHSVVDFVWYVPACMSLVVVLAASALRLAQLSQTSTQRAICRPCLPRARWLELATAVILVAAWSVYTYVGPGIAAIHWDHYLRASVEKNKASHLQATSLAASVDADSRETRSLNDTMFRELKQVIKWDPDSARAHLKLAGRYIAKFDDEQENAENAISLSNVCDAIAQSTFASHEARIQWLERAVGQNLCWLRRAVDEARTAARLNPLQGEAYVFLAQLSFLAPDDRQAAHAYTNQALRVRPRNAEVLFEIGREELAANNLDAALKRWQSCFDDPGPHQRQIVDLLTGRIPAAKLLTTFHPDWPMLRIIWIRYRESGTVDDIEALVTYSIEKTRNLRHDKGPVAPALVWYWQAQVLADVGRVDQSLACLEQAYRCDGRQYAIRLALARALHAAGRYGEAEPHYRWCLARRPMDKNLSAALVAISKARLAERTTSVAALRPPLATTGASLPAANSSTKSE